MLLYLIVLECDYMYVFSTNETFGPQIEETPVVMGNLAKCVFTTRRRASDFPFSSPVMLPQVSWSKFPAVTFPVTMSRFQRFLGKAVSS